VAADAARAAKAAADAAAADAAARAAADAAARAAADAAERLEKRGVAVKGNARLPVSRRRGIRRAISGSLRAAFVASGLLIILAGGLAVMGYNEPALLALAGAVVTSTAASLVVAVRLERSLGTSRPERPR
jgi:hypothetical protein